jgi:hypothetical protein
MGLEQNERQQYRECPDKYIDPGASYQMTTRDYVVRPYTQGVGPITLTLPPVAEAKGRFYSIVARSASAVNTITITDHNDSECWGDIVMNGKCDALLLYSDGLYWHQIRETNAPATGAPGTATATTAAPTTLAPTTA